MTLTLDDVSVVRGSQVLVEGFSTVVGDGARLGIFGPNGCGKSSLLLAIAGDIDLESGRISTSPSTSAIGYLPQVREFPAGATIGDAIRARTGVAQAEASLTASAERLTTDSSKSAGTAYEDAVQRFDALGGATLDDRAEEVLNELGADLALDRGCLGLSGGQLARVALASILLSRFDVLLLDEPTNDLDSAGLDKLRTFVVSRREPVLVVSHDREFLDQTITGVIEFDPALRKWSRFDGGYSAWQRERQRVRAAVMEANERYESEREQLKRKAIAARERSAKGESSANRAYERGRIDKLQRGAMLEGATAAGSGASQAERQLERLPRPDQVRKVWQLRLEFPILDRVTSRITLDGVSISRGSFQLGPVELSINPGDRLRVTGPNGSGKSLLLGVLAGLLAPDEGRASTPAQSRMGVLDQLRTGVPRSEITLLAWFPDATGMAAAEARTLMAKFGLTSEDVARPTSTLSPGERTRAGLALLSSRPTDVLILDEPTNHLDLPAIEQLEQALTNYRGTLVVATHDERFARNLGLEREADVLLF